MNPSAFENLTIKPELLNNLPTLGYHSMTPIQAQSLVPLLQGKDVIAQAKTGSGKTVAFGLSLLNKLDVQRFEIQALVLCPTRELADQIATELRRLARGIANIKMVSLCGGMPFKAQLQSLEHGAHIVIGTPGRIADHLRRQTLTFEHLNTLVLDEADRMLDMGFLDEIDAIIMQLPTQRQTMLFSATFPEKFEDISSRIMQQPITVKAEEEHEPQQIKQSFYQVESSQRLTALRLLLLQNRPTSTIIFCNTRLETEDIADDLMNVGFSALALHGDLNQRQRDQALIRFSNKSISILVATDVAARGLDIDELDAVINYQMAYETKTYVHRIGRTGRAGKKGSAFTLHDENDGCRLAQLSDYLNTPISNSPLPPIKILKQEATQPSMATLQIDLGKKQKIRPTDILGALTAEQGIEGTQVGKIKILAQCSYVAVEQDAVHTALQKLKHGKLKGKACRVRVM
ncbi:MAG: ATP-dependent RNA helicase DbpA [Mariprofundaceae bacterium]|nr:ATP-dependent RNA helicase DbpA [Mariprofundaceae bacterium]